MPVEVRHREPNLFIARHTGVVTRSDASLVLQTVLNHERLRPGATLLLLLTEVTQNPSTSELIGLANELKPLIARGLTRLALVAQADMVTAAAKAFSTFASVVDLEAKVFAGREAAEAWLAP
jgi:hypothetical protein